MKKLAALGILFVLVALCQTFQPSVVEASKIRLVLDASSTPTPRPTAVQPGETGCGPGGCYSTPVPAPVEEPVLLCLNATTRMGLHRDGMMYTHPFKFVEVGSKTVTLLELTGGATVENFTQPGLGIYAKIRMDNGDEGWMAANVNGPIFSVGACS